MHSATTTYDKDTFASRPDRRFSLLALEKTLRDAYVKDMVERRVLPVLPLRGAVLFPGPAVPLAVGRVRSLRALEAAAASGGALLTVTQRKDVDEPEPSDLYSVGVITQVIQIQGGANGVQIIVKGQERARVLEYHTNSYLSAMVEPLATRRSDEHQRSFQALVQEARDRALELGVKRGMPEDALRHVLDSAGDATALTDLVAAYLDLPVPDKQALLETLAVDERLRRLVVHLQRQIDVAQAQQDIKTQVQEELGGRQRELYLREQLKAIQKELGEDVELKEAAEFRDKIAKLQLPSEVRTEVTRELARLERATRESVDGQVIRSYLQWFVELPWNTRSDDQLNLARAAQVLDEDHYGLKDVKDRVLEILATRVLKARRSGNQPTDGQPEQPESDQERRKARTLAHGRILLFVGPPGTGKTSIGRSIARALGRRYARVSLGGARDEADIRGHRRTYVGAMPGRIIQGLRQTATKNPVFMLDELDKMGASFHGDPGAALLEVLDPAQNDGFMDHYLNVPFDLSEVLFIATANVTHTIPPALLDRMERVDFAGYTEREKLEIARRFLISRQLEEAGLVDEQPPITFDDDAILTLISHYTHESGVRQLEREIGAITRKIARQIASDETVEHRISAGEVLHLLGRPRIHPERASEHDEVGVATGLVYSPAGGDVIFVEAAIRRLHTVKTGDELVAGGWGTMSLILTGQLGDVMKESARAALTYAATHASQLHIPVDRLGSIEAHIHVPAGGVPKDGPSAGVTIATALASAMSGCPIHSDVAMSGEVTLRGRVLPVGGVKEKVLGAHRAGIRRVILPKRNEPDLDDIPAQVRNELEFVLVDTLDEVLEVALLPAQAVEALPRPWLS